MAFIKEESEEVKIEETFRVKHEETLSVKREDTEEHRGWLVCLDGLWISHLWNWDTSAVACFNLI